MTANLKKKYKSFSKVNLGLWVKNKREDGYHEIETIFCENKNLFDIVEIEIVDDKQEKIEVLFSDEKLNLEIPQESNLAYKAAKLFLSKVYLNCSVKIKIEKNIPKEAGVGGGSGNAAMVLKGLNELLGNPLDENELLKLAAGLGSDVPFFILGGTCLAKGRGEILTPLENKLSFKFEITKPENISISTKWAYDEIDLNANKIDRAKDLDSIQEALKSGDLKLLSESLFNDFEEVVFKKHKILTEIVNSKREDGYLVSGLCGSGSAIFSIRNTQNSNN